MIYCNFFPFQLAKKYNMVIISSILERDETHGEILANTAGKWLFPLAQYFFLAHFHLFRILLNVLHSMCCKSSTL